jgi:plastocyanin
MVRRGLLVVLLALVAANLAACSNSTGSTRTIQVDFNYDEFAGSFLDYFPAQLAVRPGMTVRFDQTWTGAPHTVTFIDRDALDAAPPFFMKGAIGQAAAQPCFVKTLDVIPTDGKACAASAQLQPDFDGSYAYYSSGLILPTGKNANRFDVPIAKDAKEGAYFYYCTIHGASMSGDITIAKNAKVVSQRELNRRARQEAKQLAAPVLAEFRKERSGKTPFAGNLAGSGDPTAQAVAAEVNEFTPKAIYTNVGSTVQWTFVGNHTISFNVPKFTPLFRREDNGDVVANDRLDKPQGGWPGAPPGHRAYPGVSTEAVHLDAGNFDGSGGLKSSGIGFNTGDTYTVTFTKRGTFPFACLIHPGMIGKVVVK